MHTLPSHTLHTPTFCNTPTLYHTHSPKISLTYFHKLFSYLLYTHSLTDSQSLLTHTNTNTLSLIPTLPPHTLEHNHNLQHSHTITHTPLKSHSLTFTSSFPISYTCTLSHTYNPSSLTQTQTHSLSYPHYLPTL